MDEKNLRSDISEIDRELILTDESDSEQYAEGFEDSDNLVDNLFSDDTDEDPTYEPELDRDLQGRPTLLDDSDYEMDITSSRPMTSTTVTNSRPNTNIHRRDIGQHRRVISSDDDENEDSEWEQIPENNSFMPNNPYTFDEIPGPKHIPPNTRTPRDFFDLFFTQTLLRLMVTETNRYADQELLSRENNISPKSRLRSWAKVTVSEVRAFIVVILNMGLIRKPTLKSYWSTSSSQATPWFAKMFSRSRFENLLTFFHLVDNEKLPKANQPGYDPCQKFQPFVDHCNKLFSHYYTCNQEISVDESMIGTKCHTSLMQYLPNKHHHRWGVKFWVLCDAVTKYCAKLFCYKGAKCTDDKTEQKELGLGFTVVKHIMSACNYLMKGYHLFIDNFFVSLGLAKWLHQQGTYMTGTCRKGRKGLPNALKSKRFQVGEKVYYKKGSTVLFAYREKKSQNKPVLVVSTKAKISMERVVKRRCGRTVTQDKPSVIAEYNKYMGGIDSHDMMLYCYLNERRQVKYWKKVVFNFISRIILNAYIIYKEVCTTNNIVPVGHYQFIVNIIESVGNEWMSECRQDEQGQGDADSSRSQNARGLQKLPGTKEKTCWVCTNRGTTANGKGRKRSRTVCTGCQEGCHAVCFTKHTCK